LLLAANAVQGEKIGNLNIPAALKYRAKTKRSLEQIGAAGWEQVTPKAGK
jgi:hypothetical protein